MTTASLCAKQAYINKKVIEEEANHFAKYAIAPPPLVKAMGVRSADELKAKLTLSPAVEGKEPTVVDKWVC